MRIHFVLQTRENIIGAPKMRINFRWTICENINSPTKMWINICFNFKFVIGYFTLAPHLFIALPTLQKQKMALLISLLKFLYRFYNTLVYLHSTWLLFCLASHILSSFKLLPLFIAFKGNSKNFSLLRERATTIKKKQITNN